MTGIGFVKFTLRRENLKTVFLLWKRIKCFSSTRHGEKLALVYAHEKNSFKEITCMIIVIISSIYRLIFFFHIKTKSRRFQIPSVVKNVLEKPLFRAGLVWTLGLVLALKLRFWICPA